LSEDPTFEERLALLETHIISIDTSIKDLKDQAEQSFRAWQSFLVFCKKAILWCLGILGVGLSTALGTYIIEALTHVGK